MEVVVGKYAGFCPGVNFTVSKAEEFLEKENLYCLGEIIHNEQVIKRLEEKGMKTVSNIEDVPNGSKLIFRAHGEPKWIYERAKEKDIDVIDLTCGKVRVIHQKVEKQIGKSFIIIVGKKQHPEVIGTKGFAGDASYVIESSDDILPAYMEYEKTNLGKVYVVAQTTFSSKLFDELVDEIRENFAEATFAVDKTICNTTEIRQREVNELSKNMSKMIVIGGKNSSNTKELAKIAEANCGNVILVQTADDLQNSYFDNQDKIGIVAGASTPSDVIEDVKKYIGTYTFDAN